MRTAQIKVFLGAVLSLAATNSVFIHDDPASDKVIADLTEAIRLSPKDAVAHHRRGRLGVEGQSR